MIRPAHNSVSSRHGRALRLGTLLCITTTTLACVPAPAPRSSDAPRAVDATSAAPTADVAPATHPVVTPCDRLQARSTRAIANAHARAAQAVESLVQRNADPLASQRAEAQRARDRLRVSGPPAELARAESALAALQRAHSTRQHPVHFVRGGAAPNLDPLRILADDSPLCVPSRNGAWGLVLDEVVTMPTSLEDWTEQWSAAARVALAFADGSDRVRVAPLVTLANSIAEPPRDWPVPAPSGLNCCEVLGGALLPLTVFDFDGDGADEVFVRSRYAHEGDRRAWAKMFTLRGGEIVEYATTQDPRIELNDIEDLNHDGRPDLYAQALVHAGTTCGSEFDRTAFGPKFAAISLTDGTFDLTGPAAQRYARSWCPRAPSAPATIDEVVCARLWGQSNVAVRASILRRFSRWSCDAENEGRPQPARNAAENYDELLAGLEVPLPLRLAP